MTPTLWWVLIVLGVALLLLAIDVTYMVRQSYFPASPQRRAAIAGDTVYHYLLAEHLVPGPGDGTVTVAVHEGKHVTGIGPGRRTTAAYYYLGRNGRGGRLNHSSRKHRDATFARIEIRGADFLSWLGDRPLKYRSWDRAVMVRDSYTGHGVVVLGDHPREDRKRRNVAVTVSKVTASGEG